MYRRDLFAQAQTTLWRRSIPKNIHIKKELKKCRPYKYKKQKYQSVHLDNKLYRKVKEHESETSLSVTEIIRNSIDYAINGNLIFTEKQEYEAITFSEKVTEKRLSVQLKSRQVNYLFEMANFSNQPVTEIIRICLNYYLL